MQVPGNWESRGLPDFDGIVWFTRTVEVPQGAAVETLSLGPIRNTARVWVNGIQVSAPAFGFGGGAPVPAPAAAAGAPAAPAAGGRGQGRGAALPAAAAEAPAPPVAANITATARAADVTIDVPKGVFKPGANTITVQVTNQRAEGGFVGAAADMFLKTGTQQIPLAGQWKYRIERSSNNGAMYSQPGELAAHVAFVAGGGTSGAAGASLPAVAAAPDVIIQLSVVPNEMKYATTELTVQPGQLVEIVFTNPDQMQHNFVLGAPGSLQTIGAAADQFTQTAGAAAQDYVPGDRAGALQGQDGRRGTIGDVPVPCADDDWRLSVSLHVSEPLADHERRAARGAARWTRPRRAAGSDGRGRRGGGIDRQELVLSSERSDVAIVGLGFGAAFIPIYQPSDPLHGCHLPRNRKELDACGDQRGVTRCYASQEELVDGSRRLERRHWRVG